MAERLPIRRRLRLTIPGEIVVQKRVCKPPYYPIYWFSIPGKKIRDPEIHLGICGYTRRFFKITTSDVKMIVMKNLIVRPDKAYCEEARRCMNLDCPFNRTTFELYYEGKLEPIEEHIRNWTDNCKRFSETKFEINEQNEKNGHSRGGRGIK